MITTMNEKKTAIDIIKNTFYLEKPPQPPPDSFKTMFQHPFDSQIYLDTSNDGPYEELIERVLEIGRSERTQESISGNLTVDEEVATYLALPSQVKVQLKEMFSKPRLTVESKPRGSTARKLSHASTSSQRRVQITNRGKKLRKFSNVSRSSQLSDSQRRRKSSIPDFPKECRKDSVEKFSTVTELSRTVQSEDLNRDPSYAENKPKTDFYVTPPDYNFFREANAGSGDDVEAEEDKSAQRDLLAWSKREHARRKVSRWLRKSNLI